MEGTAAINFTGTYTGPVGKSYTKNVDATVNFNKTRYMTITVDGNSVTIDIKTNPIIM